MQPNRASRRPIIEIDFNEVAQGSDNPRTSSLQSSARTSQQRQGSLDQRAARQGTPATGQGSLDSGSLDQRAARQRTRATEHGSLNSGSLDPHASEQGSLNPPVAGTGSLDPGSLDQRAARPEARSAEQGSLDPGSLNPHASQRGSLDPPVAGAGLLHPGSLDQRVAIPRTNGSSVSILPQAPEAAGVAEYIVLAETIAQVGIDPAGPEGQLIPVALATEALPGSVATRAPTMAVAVFDVSSAATRPSQWGRGIPVRSSTSSSSSSRPQIPDPAAYAGGPTSLDEFVNGPSYSSGAHVEDVDVDASRNPKRIKLIHQACRCVSGRVAADQALIDGLTNELEMAMRELQDSNIALDNSQQSKRGSQGYRLSVAASAQSSLVGNGSE